MGERFERDGIRCDYPDVWSRELEENDGGWTLVLESPGTAFLMLGYCSDVDDPVELAQVLLEDITSEYKDVEVADAIDNIAGQPAVGSDLSFIHLDLTNTCWIRAVPAGAGSLFVMAQCTDDELDGLGSDMRRIISTIHVDD